MVTLDLTSLHPPMARLVGASRLRRLVVGGFADFAAQPDGVRAHLQAAGQLAAVTHDDRQLAFDRLLDNDGAYVRHPIGDLRETVVVLQYTGGTTGLPKGAMPDARKPDFGLRAVLRDAVRQPRRCWSRARSGRWSCCRSSTSTR